MQIHLVSGFLGSGKTTAISTACKALQTQAQKAGVVTNDQGTRLVDTGYFDSLSVPAEQVTGSCFCCNYNALNEALQSLQSKDNLAMIFAESVGSCTDIVATVMKPLQRFYENAEVTVSTFADVRLLRMLYIDKKPLFAEEVAYIYQKQLEEAGVIVITKTDLITAEEVKEVETFLHNAYPNKTIIPANATSEESIVDWLTVITKAKSSQPHFSLQINYDTYGAGEAMLAWLDEELEIESSSHNAMEDAVRLTKRIYQKVMHAHLSIGHLKFLVDNHIKLSYTATTQPNGLVFYQPLSKTTLLINARVQAAPEILQSIVEDSIEETEREHHCKILINSLASFRPGYPTPSYRIVD